MNKTQKIQMILTRREACVLAAGALGACALGDLTGCAAQDDIFDPSAIEGSAKAWGSTDQVRRALVVRATSGLDKLPDCLSAAIADERDSYDDRFFADNDLVIGRTWYWWEAINQKSLVGAAVEDSCAYLYVQSWFGKDAACCVVGSDVVYASAVAKLEGSYEDAQLIEADCVLPDSGGTVRLVSDSCDCAGRGMRVVLSYVGDAAQYYEDVVVSEGATDEAGCYSVGKMSLQSGFKAFIKVEFIRSDDEYWETYALELAPEGTVRDECELHV